MTRIIASCILGAFLSVLHADPPEPPLGKRWVLNPDFSDEFNGTELDSSKWLDHHPTWRGRPPGLFMPSQVSVKDGCLQIRGEKMKEPKIIKSYGGEAEYTMACGAVVSKKAAFLGYYECRAKAAATTMSTTFWFSTGKNAKGPNGNDRYGLEWDIHECIGRGGEFQGDDFAYGMNSNSHYWYTDPSGKRHDHRAPKVSFPNEKPASAKFHVYGGWWRDETSTSYYYNNGEPKHQTFYNKISPKPFDRPMFMRLVSETYPFPWIELPNDEELADPTKNVAYYDWVRGYKLVDADKPDSVPASEDPVQIYKENVSFNPGLTEIKSSKSMTIPFTYQANQDREVQIELLGPSGKVVAELTFPAYAGYSNMEIQLVPGSRPKPGKGYRLSGTIREPGEVQAHPAKTTRIEISIIGDPDPAHGAASSAFPYHTPDKKPDQPLSAAMERNYDSYLGIRPETNVLYTQFRYTELKGFDYRGGDGTISRRDPSKVIFVNGKYYVWYTYRNTPSSPQGPSNFTDTIPSSDWDLSEIAYATSEDGFTWQEQGIAVPRPPRPHAGWRSVSTADILVWKGKYYLYYQGFLEASGKRGDFCPVVMSWADSPDGPWTPVHHPVVPNGARGEWDQDSIHDPYPLVHDGKIYLYYKSDTARNQELDLGYIRMHGLAIAEHPMGPFRKHPLNPVMNSGHETTLFPFKQGVAAFSIRDGNESNTIQYAEDWVNFEIASITEMMPDAAGPFVPDAFTDTKNGAGITWGISHYCKYIKGKQHSILLRFDCDLSQEIHDPKMKGHHRMPPLELLYQNGLSGKQRERLNKETKALRSQQKWPTG